MEETPTAAPRPGDPRSRGPRPPARWRDGLWLGMAVVLAAVTAVQFVRLAWIVLTRDLAIGTAGLVLAFLVTVVWLLTIWWLVAGAWRRSVWGCPFDHTDDAPRARHCPRHPLL